MFQAISQVFILNLITAIDNAIILATIFKRSPNRPWLLAICSAVILTVTRVGLVSGIQTLMHLPAIELVLGVILLLLAAQTTIVEVKRERNSFLWLLCLVFITDLAVSFDNIVAVVAVSEHPVIIAIGVFCSLLPLFLMLPFITIFFARFPWVQIVAAGIMGYTAVGVIMNDPLFHRLMMSQRHVNTASIAVATVTVGLGLVRYYAERHK